MDSDSFAKEYPLTWSYLKDNQKFLESRENGKFKNEGWYSYGRSQALDVISNPKIFTPDIAVIPSFSYDSEGGRFFYVVQLVVMELYQKIEYLYFVRYITLNSN